MAGLSKVDLNQARYRGAVRFIASVAYERAEKEVKSARARNNAVQRSCSEDIAANPRAYAQGTWEATRTTWTGTKTKTAKTLNLLLDRFCFCVL